MAKKMIGDIEHGYHLVDEEYANNIIAMERIEETIRYNAKSGNGDLSILENFDFKKATAKRIDHDKDSGRTVIYWDDGSDMIVGVAVIPRDSFDKMGIEENVEEAINDTAL